jgi:Xaa-Pro aminopeptidase
MANIHEEAARRRKELMQQMEPDSIALLCAAPQSTRSNDTEYLYRQNSDFYYLTGFVEHDAVLALIPGREQGEVVLFCQEKGQDPRTVDRHPHGAGTGHHAIADR